MSEPKRKTAMISSTSLDLPEHRQQAMDACLRQGIFPKAMEHLPARDADAIRVSLEMVDEADIYIGIYAWRYGHVPEGHDISITEMEFNRAVERGVAPGVYADVNVRLVHHLQRDTNGVRVACWKMLHRLWEDTLAQAGIHRLLAMLRQIE